MSVWEIVIGAIGVVVMTGCSIVMLGLAAGWVLERFGWVGPTERRRAARRLRAKT